MTLSPDLIHHERNEHPGGQTPRSCRNVRKPLFLSNALRHTSGVENSGYSVEPTLEH